MPPSQNLAQLLRGAVSRWNASHPASQYIDPQAEIAIARHEGLSGGIGDGGHAFGPNQLNDAGGVLTGKFAGLTPAQKNAWAWSPAGIDYALQGIAKVAGGQRGPQAVRSIATRFERPANVGAEIADALAHYGGAGTTSSPARAPMSVGAPVPSPSAPTGNFSGLGQILSQTNQMIGLGSSPALASLFNGEVHGAPPIGRKGGVTGTQPTPAGQHLSGVAGVKVDASIAPEVAKVVRQFGVSPTSGYRDAAHNRQVGGAPHSDHLTGDAVDFSGSPAALSALYKWSQGRFPYVEPMSQAKNHVHISFRRGATR